MTLQQTSSWVSVKFSSLIKTLAEKQVATELFIEEQKEAAIGEAEARLAELEQRSQILRESQGQIAAVHDLSDTDLIKVCTFTQPFGSNGKTVMSHYDYIALKQ